MLGNEIFCFIPVFDNFCFKFHKKSALEQLLNFSAIIIMIGVN